MSRLSHRTSDPAYYIEDCRISGRWDHEGDNHTMRMMFSMLVSGYLTIALVDGKLNEFLLSPFFSCKKAVRLKKVIYILWWFSVGRFDYNGA